MSLLRLGLVTAGVGLIAYAAYNYYKVETGLLENSTYDISDISVNAATLQTLSLNVGLQFQNGSDVNVTIQSLYLDIYINGTNVGYLMQTIQSQVPPQGSATIPFVANVNISSAFNALTSQIGSLLSGNETVDVKAVGTVAISSGFFSITVPVAVEKQMSI